MTKMDDAPRDPWLALRLRHEPPAELMRALLTLAVREAAADGALWLRMGVIGGEHLATDVVATDREVEHGLRHAIEGRPVDAIRLADPTAARHVDAPRFIAQPADGLLAELAQTRLHAWDGRRFLGLIALYRRDGRAFQRHERTALDRTAPDIVATVAHLDRRERAHMERPLQLVVSDSGEVRYATAVSDAWPLGTRSEAIAALVRDLAASAGGEGERVLGGVRAVVTPLVGAPRSYLVTLSVPDALEVLPGALLTERQREIAELASVGRTTGEIAKVLSVSEETVRHHVKEVYHRLGVASRVELANLMRPEPKP